MMNVSAATLKGVIMSKLEHLLSGDLTDPRIELRALFPNADDETQPGPALRWATATLKRAGVDPRDQLRAIATLRSAEPRLSLKPAVYLAALAQRSDGPA